MQTALVFAYAKAQVAAMGPALLLV